MFVENLNQEQKGYLLALSKLIISADGKVTQEEEDMLISLGARCGADITLPDEPLLDIAEKFASHTEKVSLLLELIGIALADSEYHEEEMGHMKNIANILGVNHLLLEDMENWVQRQFILIKEAKAFMEA